MECREASYGHGVLDLMNATHARWQWHRNQDAEPVVSDEVRSWPVLARSSRACSKLGTRNPAAAVGLRLHGVLQCMLLEDIFRCCLKWAEYAAWGCRCGW